MNIRHDDTVHAVWSEADDTDVQPLCGDSMIPALTPEFTTDPVDCIWCRAILD